VLAMESLYASLETSTASSNSLRSAIQSRFFGFFESKVFNVALDPITNDAPQFAQVLIPVPLSDPQKKRLIDFLQNL
jgi:hypothetical protein